MVRMPTLQTMNRGLDQEGVPRSVSDKELAAAARGRSAILGRSAALKELLQRKASVGRRIVDEVLADPSAPLELRTTAARALGRIADRGAEKTLLAGLKARQPALVARVAESLGRIGGPAAFAALGHVKVKTGTAEARTIRFARSLIAYRHGIDEARLRRPPAGRLLEVDKRRTAQLAFETVSSNTFRAAEGYLEHELPGIPVSKRGSLRLRCRQEHLWLVFGAEVEGAAATARVATGPAVVAVLLKESQCPDSWYVYEYFLSHPRANDKADLFGVRPTGEISHVGEIDLDGVDAAVRVRTVNSPRQPAIRLEAEYSGRDGLLTVKEAAVATRRVDDQKPPSAPRPDTLSLPS